MYQPGWKWGGDGWRGMDTCICMAESLHCSPETITTFLIGYTPKQNDFGVKKKKKRKRKKCTGDLNRHLSKERHTDVQEVRERCAECH